MITKNRYGKRIPGHTLNAWTHEQLHEFFDDGEVKLAATAYQENPNTLDLAKIHYAALTKFQERGQCSICSEASSTDEPSALAIITTGDESGNESGNEEAPPQLRGTTSPKRGACCEIS